MKIQTQHFRRRAEEALADSQLRGNLLRAGTRFKTVRDAAFSRLSDPQGIRDRGREIKERSMAHLPQLLEDLEARILERGGVVHWAPTAAHARRIISDLARQYQVRSVVKGKSMMTEEIGLNDHLQAQGIDSWETDLGEFIVQLAGEPPSHIIGPAIHKSKGQVADLFARKLGVERTEVPEELTAIARASLRERFLGADMGVTGANMAVAETGSIVLLENEGNIRMSVTVPRVQVVLMGIEKVIPTLEDMSLLIALLSRAATGQKLSNYVSILTGPRQDGELDGPEALHVVIMDNGRSRILADPDLRSCLHCIRCGSCFNVCPVYLTVGGHSYGWVYSGPIGSILTPQLVPARLARLLPFASTLCGACAEVCPVRIDLPKLLLTLRQRLTEDPNWDGGIPLQERVPMALYGRLLTRPRLYEAAWRAVRLLHPVLAPGGEWVALPPPLARWARSRWVPPLARPFSRGWQGLRRALGQGGDGA